MPAFAAVLVHLDSDGHRATKSLAGETVSAAHETGEGECHARNVASARHVCSMSRRFSSKSLAVNKLSATGTICVEGFKEWQAGAFCDFNQ